jgi:hypothetical protein
VIDTCVSGMTTGGMPEDLDSTGILRAVREVDWAAYAMPPSGQWYEPDEVPEAFRVLVTASSPEEGRRASSRMLFAIGNNHAGCLYPAAAPAAPLLVRVVREHEGWARWVALEILIDCLYFGVDREQFTDPSGVVVRTKDVIVAAVQGMREDLERYAREPLTGLTAKSARDLLERLDDELPASQ